jgi:hypothetical protein
MWRKKNEDEFYFNHKKLIHIKPCKKCKKEYRQKNKDKISILNKK